MTDESSEESTGESGGPDEPKDQSVPPERESEVTGPLSTLPGSATSSTTSSQPTSPKISPSKSESTARAKEVVEEEKPQDPSDVESIVLRGNKVESSSIPVEGDEVVKPEEPNGREETFVNPEETQSPSRPEDSFDNYSTKKPQDLTLPSDLISTNNSGLGSSLPSKSQDSLEPSSPDSFNTTQSVAGSEVPSVSVSETDFMNRTTSVDEVEDLPPEEFLLENTPTPPDAQTQILNELRNESRPTELSSAVQIPSETSILDSLENSPVRRAENEDPTPSPETIFERQLELPVETHSVIPAPELKVEIEEALESLPLEPTERLCSHAYEVSNAHQVNLELLPPRPFLSATVPLSLASEDVHSIEIHEPEVRILEDIPAQRLSSPIERPQSITLAVAEWLKVQGSDALTPVNQLQEIFEENFAEDESGTEEENDEDEEDHLTADDLDTLSGQRENVSAAPSNCSIQ